MVAIASPGTTGNDIIIPGVGGETLYGDPFVDDPLSTGRGGNDRLSATGNFNTLFGDAHAMSGDARGGNDRLTVAGVVNYVSGDAYSMTGDARGGNDRLTAMGDGGNYLFGDALLHSVGRRPRRRRPPDRHG